MPVQTVFFIHIPKTAGISVNAALRRSGFRAIPMVDGEFASPPAGLPHFYTGHYGLSHDIFRRHRGRPYTAFTVIREPVARMISNYNFTLRRAAAPWHEETASGALDLVGLARNFTTAIGHQYSYFARQAGDPVGVCLENLFNRIHEFGLTERIDDLFELLAPALGQRVRATTAKNVTAEIEDNGTRLISRHDVSARQLRELTEILAADLWFYENARQEYERRWNACVDRTGDGGQRYIQNSKSSSVSPGASNAAGCAGGST